MANLKYIRPNELRTHVKRIRAFSLYGCATAGALGFFVHPLIPIFLAGIGVWVWNTQNRQLNGAEGEERALGLPRAFPGSLIGLPDSYTLFNNLHVQGNRGPRELDLVVVGPNGIFIVEAKNYKGEIHGAGNDPQWQQIKRSRRGNSYPRTIGNPVSQIRGAALALKEHLKREGVYAWIEGIVVFTEPDCTLNVGETGIPVIKLPALTDTILHHAPRQRSCPPFLLVKALARIQSGDNDRPTPRPARQTA